MLVILVAEEFDPHRELVTGEWGVLLFYEGGFFIKQAEIFPGGVNSFRCILCKILKVKLSRLVAQIGLKILHGRNSPDYLL